VQRIVARHGGRAWAEAVVGGGAQVFFSIPRARERVMGGDERCTS
jgi:signal transduction histidine kinase